LGVLASGGVVPTPIADFLGGERTAAFDKLLDEARTSSIGTYKKRSPQDVVDAERAAAPQLSLYGYETSTANLTATP